MEKIDLEVDDFMSYCDYKILRKELFFYQQRIQKEKRIDMFSFLCKWQLN